MFNLAGEVVTPEKIKEYLAEFILKKDKDIKNIKTRELDEVIEDIEDENLLSEIKKQLQELKKISISNKNDGLLETYYPRKSGDAKWKDNYYLLEYISEEDKEKLREKYATQYSRDTNLLGRKLEEVNKMGGLPPKLSLNDLPYSGPTIQAPKSGIVDIDTNDMFSILDFEIATEDEKIKKIIKEDAKLILKLSSSKILEKLGLSSTEEDIKKYFTDDGLGEVYGGFKIKDDFEFKNKKIETLMSHLDDESKKSYNPELKKFINYFVDYVINLDEKIGEHYIILNNDGDINPFRLNTILLSAIKKSPKRYEPYVDFYLKYIKGRLDIIEEAIEEAEEGMN